MVQGCRDEHEHEHARKESLKEPSSLTKIVSLCFFFNVTEWFLRTCYRIQIFVVHGSTANLTAKMIELDGCDM